MKQVIILSIIFASSLFAQKVPILDWVQVYDGPIHGIDMVNDMKLKGDRINIIGRSQGADSSADLCVLQYNTAGDSLNVIRYISKQNSWEEGYSIMIDDESNFYLSGIASFGEISSFAIFQKYSQSGQLIWHKDLFNMNEKYSSGEKVILDELGNPIFGYISYQDNSINFKKYSSSGDSIWHVSVNNDSFFCNLSSMSIDEEGNLLVALSKQYDCGNDVPCSEVEIIKIDQNLDTIIKKSFSDFESMSAKYDNAGDIVLMLYAYNDTSKIIKLSPLGNTIWEYNIISNSDLVLRDFDIDIKNNIIFTGYERQTFGFDYLTEKVSSDGEYLWENYFNSDEDYNDFSGAVITDSGKNVYVTGHSENLCYTLKYDSLGNFLWKSKNSIQNMTSLHPIKMSLTDNNDIIITGETVGDSNGWNYFVFKIKEEIGVKLQDENNSLSLKYEISQNYPNPFNSKTKLSFSLPKSALTRIEIFNCAGQKVGVIANSFYLSGMHSITFDAGDLASGLYYYKISADNYTEVKKAILIK